eukprot:1313958-Prymnesium_polylepis.1
MVARSLLPLTHGVDDPQTTRRGGGGCAAGVRRDCGEWRGARRVVGGAGETEGGGRAAPETATG